MGAVPQVFKDMFLDAVGEARDSPRRNVHQGMWHKHVFNEGTDREIEVSENCFEQKLFLSRPLSLAIANLASCPFHWFARRVETAFLCQFT